MGHEERERKFERALARYWRRGAVGARNDAEVRADVRDETGGAATCVDGATLAAFHEGLLLNEELNVATEHIAGCSRCQQILLLLEETDEIPLQLEVENDLKMPQPAVSAGRLYADDTAIQTASATI